MNITFAIKPDNQRRVLSVSGSEFGSVGAFTYGEANISLWDDRTRLDIGKFCSLASSFFYLGGNHPGQFNSGAPDGSNGGLWVRGESFASGLGLGA